MMRSSRASGFWVGYPTDSPPIEFITLMSSQKSGHKPLLLHENSI
jgi:hypothetical protein